MTASLHRLSPALLAAAVALLAFSFVAPAHAQTASCNALSANMGPSSTPSPINAGGAVYDVQPGGGAGGSSGSDSAAQAACQQIAQSNGTSGVCQDKISYTHTYWQVADPNNPVCQTTICGWYQNDTTWQYNFYPGVTSITSSPPVSSGTSNPNCTIQAGYNTGVNQCNGTDYGYWSNAGVCTYSAPSTPAPTVSIAANPSSITQGNSSTVSWSSSNATSCTGTNFSTGGATSGSVAVSPSSSTSYSVTCTGPGGSRSANTSVTVGSSPPPPPPTSGCVSYQGQSCTRTSGANSCGMTSTSGGTYDCNGVCSATIPSTPPDSSCNTYPSAEFYMPNGTAYQTFTTPGVQIDLTYLCRYSQTWGTYAATISPGSAINGNTAGAGIQGYNSNGDAIVYGDSNTRWVHTNPLYNTTTFTLTCYSSTTNAPTRVSITANVQAPDLVAGPVSNNPGSFPTTGFTLTPSSNPVQLYSVITNQGNAATGAMFADLLYVSNSSNGANAVSTSGTYDGPLNANATLKAQGNHVFDTPGTYYVADCADTSNAVAESNESNNCGVWTPVTVIANADLTADTPATVSGTAGTSKTLNGTVRNASNTAAPSGGFWNTLQVCNSGCTSLNDHSKESWVSSMAAGPSSSVVSSTYTLPSTPGTYYYRWCANNNTSWVNTVTESNYGNNCSGWGTLTVSPPISGSCSVSPLTGQSTAPATLFTWTAYPSGGDGTYVYSWSGTDGLSGSNSSASKTYSTPGTKTGSVQITSAGQTYTANCSNSASVTNCGTASATITSTPTRVPKGSSVQLVWSATNVKTSCTITGTDGFSTTATPPSGSCSISTGNASITINNQTKYTINCDNGTSVKSVTVNVIPSLSEF